MVDLYREWKCDEWCEYLYDNIWTFIDSCKSIRVFPQDRDNVANEAILEAHNSITKSLDREYAQIYNYVKLRVVSQIKKMYAREQIHINRYFETELSSLENMVDGTICDTISNKTVLEILIKWILSLSEQERQVIYLRIFNYPHKTLNEISTICCIDARLLSSRYGSAVKKIKKYLDDNWIDNESIF